MKATSKLATFPLQVCVGSVPPMPPDNGSEFKNVLGAFCSCKFNILQAIYMYLYRRYSSYSAAWILAWMYIATKCQAFCDGVSWVTFLSQGGGGGGSPVWLFSTTFV